MARPQKPNNQSQTYRVAVLGGGIFLVVAMVWWNWPQPQMGYDKDAFAAVDALFTAINAHDVKLVSHCEERLATLAQNHHISPAAESQLNTIAASARSGNWERSARKLYDLMRAQRRDVASGSNQSS